MVKELLQEIARFDCEPSVFEVSLSKPQYLDCFVVTVVFRDPKGSKPSSATFTVRHEEPVTALETALAELKSRYGKCLHCGNYINHAG